MEKIKIGICGIGNCASSLVQGIEYYKNKKPEHAIGLMHWVIHNYTPRDIEITCAFDIDKRKVGKDVSEAIFSKPNCSKTICENIPHMNVEVKMGRILDGFAPHMKNYAEESSFLLADAEEPTKEKIVEELTKSECEVLLNYLPVGSDKAVKFYAECALKANVGFINCMPVFIASDPQWANKFERKNIPIIGDDIKSQLGATIVHRVLTNLFKNRGVHLDRTYQLNTGGNTDFLNMLDRNRLASKKTSKTEAVQSQTSLRLKEENIHIGPSDWVSWQKDNKICFIRMEGRIFGDIPIDLELRLSVQDSPNSAGVVIDAIRCMKLALDREQGGILYAPSAFFMKHPPMQLTDEQAFELTEDYIKGDFQKQSPIEIEQYIKNNL
ncbi:MAG: Inositol-3-phosphate synthase [Promethearchaeota archaeon]|jgi:myo-inositol-1-phosphate synthase|nr:MAG: Inositol-3-phosphate synthase [Candidatus Lokiarchaeota archaeon]